MPQLGNLNNSFAAGEISEDAWERSDLEQIGVGCEEALNFLGLTTGAIVSRGGFYRRGAPKHQNLAQRIFPWAVRGGEGLVLEFGELYARVWTAGGAIIETSPGSGTPYEFAHGYSAGDLQGLRLKQVGDVGFITSRDGLLNVTIRRLANNSWVSSVQALRNGPWLAENADPNLLLQFTDLGGGAIQVECVGPGAWTHFSPAHVGAQLRVRPPGGYPGLRTWAPNTAVGAGDSVISVGRVYQTAVGGTTGNTPPNHEQGDVSDGAVTWTFQHDGAVALRIDTYATASQVVGVFLGTPPFDLTGGPVQTANWSDQGFSDARGRPTALVAVREERLVFAGSPERPDVVDLSRTAGWTADYADFKPGLGTGLVVDDDACRTTLGDEGARIVWLVDAVVLVAGTTEGEWIIGGATIEDPITPSTIKPVQVSSYGSADVMPVKVQGPPPTILYMALGGTTLRELPLGGGANSAFEGRDLSLLAQHIFGIGVVEMAWSRPDDTLWLRLADGSLAAMTYHKEHGVIGTRRQPIGANWAAEGICVATGPDGKGRLHLAAVRVKDGSFQRAHFVLAPRGDAMFLDCADTYSGAPTTTIGGLAHFNGEEVAVVADGSYAGLFTVSGGTITLTTAASNVVVGHLMTRRLKTLPFDPRRDGLPVGKKSRPSHVYVSMKGVEVTVRSEAQDEPDSRAVPTEKLLQRRPGDTTPVVRRKRGKVTLGGGADADVRVIIETQVPYDIQLFALRPIYETPAP